MGWNKTIPTSGSLVASLSSIFEDNWSATDSVLSKEHNSLSTSISGRHLAGKSGILFKGTSAEIAAITSPETGALAQDTDKGQIYRYTGTAWSNMGSEDFCFSMVLYNPPTDIYTYETTVTSINTTYCDLLSEFSSGIFYPKSIPSMYMANILSFWHIPVSSIPVSVGLYGIIGGVTSTIQMGTLDNNTRYTNAYDQDYQCSKLITFSASGDYLMPYLQSYYGTLTGYSLGIRLSFMRIP